MVIYEGASDTPREALGDRTPFQVARSPGAARLASEGRCGWMPVLKEHDRRSEVLLGLSAGLALDEARALYRGPLEAATLGADAAGFTYAFRGNFVTMDGGQIRESRVSRLSREETQLLAQAVQHEFDGSIVRILAVAPGRVCVLLKSDADHLREAVQPELAEGEAEWYLPQGRKGEFVRDMLEKSGRALTKLTVNDVRVDLGENPATHLWLWGGGAFARPAARAGAVLTNSPLAAGLGKLLGMAVHDLLDPWSDDDQLAAMNAGRITGALRDADFLLVYVESPREAGAFGSPTEKVRLLERLDLLLLEPLLGAASAATSARLALTTDNTFVGFQAKPVRHVPLAVWGHGIAADGVKHFDEVSCADGSLGEVAAADVFDLLTGEN